MIKRALLCAVPAALGLHGLDAAAQAPSGLYCQGVEIAVADAPALRIVCDGALYFDRTSVIQAEESISLVSTGTMTLWGILVAPRIDLYSNSDLSVGGVFSGMPDVFPEVRATSWAGTDYMLVRSFSDLVPHPYVDPVYGAAVFTQQYVEPVPEITPIEVGEIVFISTEPASPVPESAMPAMFAAGLAVLAWRRRSASMSRTAHAPSKRNVTFEN